MNQYVTSQIIKSLREKKNMTQKELAEKLYVSEKTISKWETGNGFPDISILEDLAKALDISIIELLNGKEIKNNNLSCNILKIKFYVCPISGNIITSMGESVVNSYGLTLTPLDPETPDEKHTINIEIIEDEYYITMKHPMTKDHYISFIAAIKDDSYELKKFYPESDLECRFKISRTKYLYYYCNRHGLYKHVIA